MTDVPPRAARVVRLALVALAGLALAIGVYLVATTVPTRNSLYPKCVTFTALGVHCPGCGTGRAMHFLLNGQPLTALRCNAFAPFFLPFLFLVAFRALLGWALRLPQPNRRPVRAFWLWLLAAGLIVYTVARNIPTEPFSYLAPKEIEPVNPSARP
jgi:hypothetical protein